MTKAEITVASIGAQAGPSSEAAAKVGEAVVNLADLNRAQRRRFRRALNAEHRKSTRYYRRHSVMPQWQATILAKEAQKRRARQQEEWDVIDKLYGTEIARV